MYRHFVSEALRIISENTAKNVKDGGTYMSIKLSEMLKPDEIETRSADEIISAIKRKLQ